MPPWRPCPPTSCTFMPTMPISGRASFTSLSFSSRIIASIFFVMLLSPSIVWRSRVSALAMLADIQPHLFFRFCDAQPHYFAQRFCDDDSEYHGEDDGGHCADKLGHELARVAV